MRFDLPPVLPAGNTIPNRQVICQTLLQAAETDRDIVVLCSDSRGSTSMTPFAERYPERFVETGIAEQNLTGIAAGLAHSGKKPYVASPASFLSTRSYEQAKIECAYSGTNVKLIGVSGGVSYGALGMSHHSLQDIAAMSAIPGMRVYFPSDRRQTRFLIQSLLCDAQPAYVRVSRLPSQDLYPEDFPFEMDCAVWLADKEEADVLIAACGETVAPALEAARLLQKQCVTAAVLDCWCLKPFDCESLLQAAARCRAVVTVEEHVSSGGLGSLVCQCLAQELPRRCACMSLPDAPVITGSAQEVFRYYGLTGEGIASRSLALLKTL